MKLPEILAPAGNREKCATALLYGADAVYLGGKAHNLRAATDGFDQDDLIWAVQAARDTGAAIYYCLNSLPMQSDMAGVPAAIEMAAQAGVGAFIVADPGIFRLVQRYAPHIPLHVSTQANTTNADALAFWHDAGAKRVNLARELSCRDIHAIYQTHPEVELEVFTHGAMCLAVSGQCLLSAWLNDRPANLGRCTQPCRFEYKVLDTMPNAAPQAEHCSCGQPFNGNEGEMVVEEKMRAGQAFWRTRLGGADQEAGYSSLWAPEDLCLMPYLPWLVQHKVAACKIEGRMKGASYVAHVTDAYKSAMRAIAAQPTGAFFDYQQYMPELFATASRPLGTGFFLPERRRNLSQEAGVSRSIPPSFASKTLAAKVLEPLTADGAVYLMDVRGQWYAEKDIEIMLPGMQRPRVAAGEYRLENLAGERLSVTNPGQRVRLILTQTMYMLSPGLFVMQTG